MKRNMKAVLKKSLMVLAGVALVLPFVAVALLIGARATAGVEDGWGRLLLAALAIGGALLSGARGFGREPARAGEESAARAASWIEHEPRTFVGR